MRSNGYRRRTRKLFSKDFKKHGNPHTKKILQQYKLGDYVDCKVDPSVVKGMPHKYYHGKTGVVYNVNSRAVGVIFYRKVGFKYIERHVNIRTEHLTPSRSNEDMKKRYEINKLRLTEAREKGEKFIPIKRQPLGPRKAFEINDLNNKPIEVVFKAKTPIY